MFHICISDPTKEVKIAFFSVGYSIKTRSLQILEVTFLCDLRAGLAGYAEMTETAQRTRLCLYSRLGRRTMRKESEMKKYHQSNDWNQCPEVGYSCLSLEIAGKNQQMISTQCSRSLCCRHHQNRNQHTREMKFNFKRDSRVETFVFLSRFMGWVLSQDLDQAWVRSCKYLSLAVSLHSIQHQFWNATKHM